MALSSDLRPVFGGNYHGIFGVNPGQLEVFFSITYSRTESFIGRPFAV